MLTKDSKHRFGGGNQNPFSPVKNPKINNCAWKIIGSLNTSVVASRGDSSVPPSLAQPFSTAVIQPAGAAEL